MGLFDFLKQEIAIDLGTANTLIISEDKVVVDEPSIVAKDRLTDKVIAVGRQAMQMHGKTHENIKTVRPLKDGVIADFDAAEHMIKGMIKMIDLKKRSFIGPTSTCAELSFVMANQALARPGTPINLCISAVRGFFR